MEYIITKSQLYKVMTKYLNDFKDNEEETFFENFIYLSKPNAQDFNLEMSYDYNDGELSIELNWLNDFMNWFPINKEDAEYFIKDWFEQAYDVTVQSVDSYSTI